MILHTHMQQIKDIKAKYFQNNPDYELITKLERRYDKAAQAKIDISSDKDNFVVNDPVKDLNGNFRTISVKPVDISKFAKTFFETEHQIFMSATIDKSSFCENMGIEKDDVSFLLTLINLHLH